MVKNGVFRTFPITLRLYTPPMEYTPTQTTFTILRREHFRRPADFISLNKITPSSENRIVITETRRIAIVRGADIAL